MAVVDVSSPGIILRDTVPRVFSNAGSVNGRERSSNGTVTITNTDSVASIYRVCQDIPSNAFVRRVQIWAPDIGTTTAANIGVYKAKTADAGLGAVVSASFFASAFVLNAGAVSAVDVTHQSGTYTLAQSAQPLWQALGLTSDPQIMYDICLTLSGAADATGLVRLTTIYAN